MELNTEQAFRGEIHDQALVAERALARIRTAIVLKSKPESERVPRIPDLALSDTVHDAVCLFLDSAAVVSKILKPWPQERNSQEGKASIARGEELMRKLALSGDEEFLPRDVRNSIEHVDEKLERWLAAAPRPFIERWAIIWPGDEGDWRPLDALRTFDARTMDVSIMGDRCNLGSIYRSLCELDRKVAVNTSDLTLSIGIPGRPPSSVSVRMVTGSRPPDGTPPAG